jgi:hypothetical protein
MRALLLSVVLMAACSVADATPLYDVYILQPRDGASVYAFASDQNAAALEVRGCGDVRVLTGARAIVDQMRDRRGAENVSVVTVVARGSRTNLGPCGEDEADEDQEQGANDSDTLVVIEHATASQLRSMIRTLDAAPASVRQQLMISLGLVRGVADSR